MSDGAWERMHRDLKYLRCLAASGSYRWCAYPWHNHLEVLGTGLTICDYREDGDWCLWTRRYTIHVCRIGGSSLEDGLSRVDWLWAIGRGKALDYDFSLTPDMGAWS